MVAVREKRVWVDGDGPVKQLEDEHARLKKLGQDLSLDKEMLQDVICRKLTKPSRKHKSWSTSFHSLYFNSRRDIPHLDSCVPWPLITLFRSGSF